MELAYISQRQDIGLPSGRCIQERDYTNEYIIASSSNNAIMYSTANGRKVQSGGGIQPDLFVEKAEITDFTKKVKASGLITDYAIMYRQKTPKGGGISTLTTKDYQHYISFLKENADKIILDIDKVVERLNAVEDASLFEKEIKSIDKRAKKQKLRLIEATVAELNEELNRILDKAY